MAEKKLSIRQNFFYNSAGSLFYLACQWLITVLVVKLSSYENAGDLSLAVSITNVFFTLATFGIRTFQVSDINNKYSSSSYVTTRIVTGCVSFVLCMGFVLLNRDYSLEQMLCIVIYMVFRLSEALVDVCQAIQQKAYRMDYIAKSCVMRGVLLLGSFSGVLYLTQSLVTAISVMSVSTMSVVLFYDLRVACRLAPFRLHIRLQDLKSILLECWPLMLTSMLMTSIVSIPRYILELLHSNEVLGFYSSVATPAVIVQTACSLIYNPLISVLAESYEKRDKKSYLGVLCKALGAILGVAAVMIAGAAVFGRWGLHLLFGDKILPYTYLLIPVLFTTILIAMGYFMNMMLTISRHLKAILVCNATAVAIIAAISVPIIRRWSMDGVNYVLYLGLGATLLLEAGVVITDIRRRFSTCGKQE